VNIALGRAAILGIGLVFFLLPGPQRSRADLQHNLGKICSTCHPDFAIGGTIFTDGAATSGGEGVGIALIAEDGLEVPLGTTDSSGNLAVASAPAGRFLIRAGHLMSRTWHALPGQGSCNSCHSKNGNSSKTRTRQFPLLHTRIPADNNCTHCHHYPASMSYGELATAGVLAIVLGAPAPPASQVELLGRIYPFDPAAHAIVSVRADIFAPGYFSIFDVILEVARANGIAVEYHYDDACKTHFIDKINGVPADYWYHFSFDAGGQSGNSQEVSFRRANRWDELLWRPGVWIRVVSGENLAEIRSEYLEEIERESASGHMIPSVQISVNATPYRNNPLGSGRIRSVQRQFRDVQVTAHNTRSIGYPSPNARPFQPGVTTALDVLLSLKDQGHLDLVTTVHYSYFGQNYIDSQYVVALGFPGLGTAHSSGYHGFIYVTENGSANRLPNNADNKLHVTSDILVIHAPDFATWQWRDSIGPGLPYYENAEPAGGLPGDQDRLCIPLPANSQLQTGVAVVNELAAAAAANWILRSDTGTPMAVSPEGANPGRTVVPSHGQLARMVPELFGGTPVSSGGWLEMLGDEPGMSGFFLVFDPAIHVLDGVDLSGRRMARFVFPELPAGQRVDLALVNTDETRAADVTIRLRDDSGIASGNDVMVQIAARSRFSRQVTDLFPGAAGYLEFTSTVPLAAVEQFGVPGADIAMLNAVDQAGGAQQLYAPQFVQGAGYKSVLTLVNLEAVPTRATLFWIDSNGTAIGQPAEIDLPGNGRTTISDPAVFGAAPKPEGLQGYVAVTSSATRIAGSVRFGDPAEARFQTALPLVSEGMIEALFGQIANDPLLWYTGLAVVNPNAETAQLVVEIFDTQGIRVGRGEVPIPPHGRISKLLSDIVPDLPAMARGYFKVRADRPVVSFAVFGPRTLAALAAIPPQVPAVWR